MEEALALLEVCKDRILAVLQARTILALACWQRLAGEKVKGVSGQNPGPLRRLGPQDCFDKKLISLIGEARVECMKNLYSCSFREFV